MLAQFVAWRAAVSRPSRRVVNFCIRALLLAVAAHGLAGCLPNAPPLSGADPADPAAAVPGVTYRSTTAPYRAMRPAEPAPWTLNSERAPPPPVDSGSGR